MIFRSKIHLRRRLLLFMAVGLVIAVCAFIYLLFLFLSLDSMPLADGMVTRVLDRLLEGQVIDQVDLKMEVDPIGSRVRAWARVTFDLPQDQSHPFLRHLLFNMPTDLVFFLHPALRINRVVWGDRDLLFERVKSMVFVDLDSQPPLDGIVVLDIHYEGTLRAGEGGSILAKDLIYLDPEDNYYPSQAGTPHRLKVEMILPEGLHPVLPDLGGSVSTFALAATPFEPVSRRFGKMECLFYGWEEAESAWQDALDEVSWFFDERGLGDTPRTLKFIKAPRQLEGTIRYDDTGTILLPGGVSEADLAFIMALYRIRDFVDDEEGLFTCEEVAEGLSLYFLQRSRGEGPYQSELYRVSMREGSLPLPYRASARFGLATRRGYGVDAGPGAYCLSILRRMVGDNAYDRMMAGMLNEQNRSGDLQGWENWNEAALRYTGEDLRWLLKNWARRKGTLDLEIADIAVEKHDNGQTVTIVLRNLGNLNLPEKVKVLTVTETGAIPQMLPVTRSRSETSLYVPSRVLAVVVDPDMEWYDTDRGNNVAYLAPPPYLVMPSEDNLHLAAAYRKRVDAETHPLVVFQNNGEDVEAFFLEHPVQKIQWINGHRLLVHARSAQTGIYHYLVDTRSGLVESFGSGMEILPSDSGRYLLINDKEGAGWRHRLKDLEKKLTRRILSKVPYRLEWLPGIDLVTPVYPYGSSKDVEIFSTSGKVAYRFSKGEARLFAFQGYEGGLAFLREKDGVYSFYTLAAPGQEPRKLAALADEVLGFGLSRFGGTVYLEEAPATDRVRITRLDPTTEKMSVLYAGSSEGLYDLFSDKGVLKRKNYADEEGRIFEDIQFHRFSEQEGRFITHSPPPERVLALAGNQRYLYYAEEIQADWSPLPCFNLYRFFRYDFLSREVSELDFSAWSP